MDRTPDRPTVPRNLSPRERTRARDNIDAEGIPMLPEFEDSLDVLRPVDVKLVKIVTQNGDPTFFDIDVEVTFRDQFRYLTDPPMQSATFRLRDTPTLTDFVGSLQLSNIQMVGNASQKLVDLDREIPADSGYPKYMTFGDMTLALINRREEDIQLGQDIEVYLQLRVIPGNHLAQSLGEVTYYNPLGWNKAMGEIVRTIGPSDIAKRVFGPEIDRRNGLWFFMSNVNSGLILGNQGVELKLVDHNKNEGSYAFKHDGEPNVVIDEIVLQRLFLFALFINSEAGSNVVQVQKNGGTLYIDWDIVSVTITVAAEVQLRVYEKPRSGFPVLETPYEYIDELNEMVEFAKSEIYVKSLFSPVGVEVVEMKAGDGRYVTDMQLRVTFPDGFRELFDPPLKSASVVFQKGDSIDFAERVAEPIHLYFYAPNNSIQLAEFMRGVPRDPYDPSQSRRTIEIEGEGIKVFIATDTYNSYTFLRLVLNPHEIASKDSKFAPVLQRIVKEVGPENILNAQKRHFDFDIGVTNHNQVFLLVQNGYTMHFGELQRSEFLGDAQEYEFKMGGIPRLDNHKVADMVQFVNTNSQLEPPILDVASNYPKLQINWDSCSVIVQGTDGFKVTFFDPPRDNYPEYPKPEQIEKVMTLLRDHMTATHDRYLEANKRAANLRMIQRAERMDEDKKVKCRYTKYRPVYEEDVFEQIGDKRVKITKEGGCQNETDYASLEELKDKMVFQTATGTCFEADDPDHNTPDMLRDLYFYHTPGRVNERWNAAGTEIEEITGEILATNCFDKTVIRPDSEFLRARARSDLMGLQ